MLPKLTQFPFSAVVAMDDMRLALILNAVSPAIGGVLVRGEKGTAKSTAVRALTAVLPPVDVVAGCRFSCSPAAPDPQCPDGPHSPAAPSLPTPRSPAAPAAAPARLVELPVGATEDRLTGSLDLGRALTEGVTSFQPGLLAAAHRGVLYVDEVNLLHDHLVDLLLDAAALGTNYVERDGVSVRHDGAVPAGRDHEPGGRANCGRSCLTGSASPSRRQRRATRRAGPRWCAAGSPSTPTRRRSLSGSPPTRPPWPPGSPPPASGCPRSCSATRSLS